MKILHILRSEPDKMTRSFISQTFEDAQNIEMPIYEKVSLFSRYGPWLDRICGWIYSLTGLIALFEMVRTRYAYHKMAKM